MLVELPGVIAKEPCQVLIDTEVSTDKSLLATDICIHAASTQHHAVKVLHLDGRPTSQTLILLVFQTSVEPLIKKGGKRYPPKGR